MERQFLEDLGLEQEQIDSILDENEKDIKAASQEDLKGYIPKSRFDEVNKEKKKLESDLAEKDAQLEELKTASGDVEALKQEVETLKAENAAKDEAHEKEMKQYRIDSAVDLALTGAKAKNMKAVKALLDLDNAELGDDGTVKGLAEQIQKLKGAEDSKFLFATEVKKTLVVKGAKPGESGNEDGDHGVDTSKMTYSELAAYLAEHPDAQI